MSPIRLKQVDICGNLTIYRRPKALGDKPFVVGVERNGRLVLLEEFAELQAAKSWAEENKKET